MQNNINTQKIIVKCPPLALTQAVSCMINCQSIIDCSRLYQVAVSCSLSSSISQIFLWYSRWTKDK